MGSGDYGLRVETALDRGSTAPTATFGVKNGGGNLLDGLCCQVDFMIADVQFWTFDSAKKLSQNVAATNLGASKAFL
jgi:hypothetical protein